MALSLLLDTAQCRTHLTQVPVDHRLTHRFRPPRIPSKARLPVGHEGHSDGGPLVTVSQVKELTPGILSQICGVGHGSPAQVQPILDDLVEQPNGPARNGLVEWVVRDHPPAMVR